MDFLFFLLPQDLFEKKLNVNTQRPRRTPESVCNEAPPEARSLPFPAEDEEPGVLNDEVDYSEEGAQSLQQSRPVFLAERLEPSVTPQSSSDDDK